MGLKQTGVNGIPILVCPIAELAGVKSYVGGLWGSRSVNPYLFGRKTVRVLKPSQFIYWGCSYSAYDLYAWNGMLAVGDFHSGGTFNASFHDGHVEALAKAEWLADWSEALRWLSINAVNSVALIE